MSNTLRPGIHQLTMAEYLALPYLSAGLCNTILQYSPLHAKWEQDHRQDEQSTVSEKGTAIHDGLLEGINRIVLIDPEMYPSQKGDIPTGWTNNAIRAARDSARSQGSIPMLPDDYLSVTGAVVAAKAFVAKSEIAGVFDAGKPEQTLIWQEGAVTCKARPDWLSADHSIMLHVKTTKGSASPFAFPRVVDGMGYDVALMFYERGLLSVSEFASASGCRSIILAIEQEPPHGCALYDLDPAKASLATSKVNRAISAWQECTASGKWPCYDRRIHSIEPKPWQIAEEEGAQLGDVYDQLQERQGLQA